MLPALLLAALPLSQQAPAAPDAPTSHEVFSLSSQGLAAMLVDSKDQGLRQALALLEPRLAELGRELGARLEVPPPVLILAARALTGPVRLDVGVLPEVEPGGLPFSIRLELPGATQEEARETARRMAQTMRQSGLQVRLPEGEGLVEVEEAPVPIRIGTQGTSGVLVVGASESFAAPRAGVSGADAPAFALRIDYGQLVEQMMALSGDSDPEQKMALEMLTKMGLTHLRLSLETRIEEHASRTTVVQAGYGRGLREAGIVPDEPLPASVLAAVPEDALWAQLFTFDPGGYLDFILDALDEQIAASGMQDPIEQLDQMSGFHLHRDVCDHLGTSFGVYSSDTTGGSGMTSLVAFATLRNAASFGETLTRLEELAIGMAQAETGGKVAIRSWESGGATFKTLVFPGLPIPVEPTWVIASDHLFVAASPQAALGAVHQLQHAATSLEDNARFVEQLPSNRTGLQAVGFFDTPRLLRAGYAPMSLACSALANATRSGSDPALDAGLILPPFHELGRGAKAMVTVSRFEGDDLVQETVGDRSFAVNATALAGFLIEGPFLPLLAIAGFGAWSEQQSMASSVFELPDPEPGAGEDR